MPKVWAIAWLLFIAGAGPAYAHSPVPGIKGFYVGLLHPFSTPPQALLLVGLGLLVGAFDTGKVRWLLGTFLIASSAGLILALGSEALDATLYAAAFLACVVAALLPGKIIPVAIAITAFGGFLIGEASVPDAGPPRDRLFTMSGSMVGANIGLLYIFGIIHLVRERFVWAWVAIAFRVAAAWVGAVALLMLALKWAEVAPSA